MVLEHKELDQNHRIEGKENKIKKKLDTNCIFTVYYSIRKRRKYMDNKCDKCGKIPASVEYKGKKYCTWYCAKKD